MEPYLIYIGKVALAAGAFYIAYLLLFQNQKHFTFNRFYLPVSMALSFVIPLITFTTVKYIEPVSTSNFSGFEVLNNSTVNIATPQFVFEWFHYLFAIYILGSLGFLFHLVLGHLKAISIIQKSRTRIFFDALINITIKDVHPFSFFTKIVISENTLNHPDLKMIVEHENIHVKEKHTLDILFAEILFLFQWFNPFAWLIKDAMKNNLEYLTDSEIAQKYDPQSYQLAMVSLADKKGLAPFLTALNGNQLKNRIVMMKKKTENKYNLLKQFLVLPLLAVLVMGLSNKVERTELIQNEQQISNSKMSKLLFYRLIIDGEEIPVNTMEMQQLNLWEMLDSPVEKRTPGFLGEVSREILKVQNINPDKLVKSRYSSRYPNGWTLFIRTKDYVEGTNPEFDKEIKRYSAGVPIDNYKKEQEEGIEEYPRNGSYQGSGYEINGKFNAQLSVGSDDIVLTPATDEGISIKTKGDKSKQSLYVVDGVTVKSVNGINPENIESISVLKDESATSLYGEKGKNGVIEILLKSKTFEAEQKFRELITKEIKYPEEALKAYIEKDIYFSLRIDQNGNLHRDAFVPEIDIQQIVVIGERIETNETMTKKAKSEVERVEFFSKEFNRVVGEIKQVDLEELKGKSLRVNVSFKIKEENGYVEINSKKSQPITNELELRKFFAKRIKYPYDAVENGIVGKISVSVTIDKNLNIVETGKSNIENENVGEVVVTAMIGENKSLTQDDESEILRKEVLRVIKLIPVLDISEFKGKTVNLIVKFNLAE